MAKRIVDDASLTAVADAIREQTGKTDPLTFPADFASAPAELVGVGKKSAYDEFWDAYQNNGQRTSYQHAFAGFGWTNTTFKPRYDISPKNASSIFLESQITGDLVEILRSCGITMDFSNCTNMGMAFQSSKFTGIGVIDVSVCTGMGQCFAWCSIVTIDKLIVSETTVFSSGTFNGGSLQSFTMEGVLASTISFTQCSKLTAESAKSVISCLKNFTGTGSENTKTVSFHANTWALLDAEGNASPTGKTWRDYIVSDLRWNV